MGIVRTLTAGDLPALLLLEREVWGKRKIESIDFATGRRWIEEGFCLGHFDENRLRGYAYGETISFSRVPPYSLQIIEALESYKETSSVPGGNALHGLSMAVARPGAGASLLTALVDLARHRGLEYFVSLARLEGLGRFIVDNPELKSRDIQEVACFYAIQAVS
ncbi:MAG TPA: hypothetical protein VF173_12485 [Thermoanaerobaculia bacterium]|nr:hypothetical protein [Thermoanaerobaculia bacterium]